MRLCLSPAACSAGWRLAPETGESQAALYGMGYECGCVSALTVCVCVRVCACVYVCFPSLEEGGRSTKAKLWLVATLCVSVSVSCCMLCSVATSTGDWRIASGPVWRGGCRCGCGCGRVCVCGCVGACAWVCGRASARALAYSIRAPSRVCLCLRSHSCVSECMRTHIPPCFSTKCCTTTQGRRLFPRGPRSRYPKP